MAQRVDRSDREIARGAEPQHGVLTLAQLQEIGLSARAVSDRVAAGRLHRLHRGVFAAERPTRRGRWMGAVLAAGEEARLSHRSAVALWGLIEDRDQSIHVTVADSTTRRRPTLKIHSGGMLRTEDVTTCDRIPCTSVPRTLLDLAATVDRRTLERAIDRAEGLRLFDLRALDDVMAHNRGRRGNRALASLLAGYRESTETRSEVEERLLALVRAAGLPTPRVNAWLALPDGGGCRPDFLWRHARLVVEVDGREYHATRRGFQRDRRRDRRLALAGFETRRYSAREVLREPERVMREIRAFLGRDRRL